MRHISTATIIVVVLAATVGGAGAQAPTPTGVPEYQVAINALRDSQWVRLAVPDNGRRDGQLLSAVLSWWCSRRNLSPYGFRPRRSIRFGLGEVRSRPEPLWAR